MSFFSLLSHLSQRSASVTSLRGIFEKCLKNTFYFFEKYLKNTFDYFEKILSTSVQESGLIRYKISTVYSFHVTLGILLGNQLQKSQNSHFMSIFLGHVESSPE